MLRVFEFVGKPNKPIPPVLHHSSTPLLHHSITSRQAESAPFKNVLNLTKNPYIHNGHGGTFWTEPPILSSGL